jgi:hypothetical protein
MKAMERLRRRPMPRRACKGVEMPRTAVNLPDPTQTPARGAVSNADDLLSQLAGEELDRLLSEAESAPADASGFELPDEQARDAGEASLDELFNELDDKELPTLAEDDTPPPAPPPPFSKAPIAEVTPVAPPAKPLQAAAATAAPLSAADDLAAEMEADERAHAAALRRMKGAGAEEATAAPARTAQPAMGVESAAPAVADAHEAADAIDQPVTIDPDVAALADNPPEFEPAAPPPPFLVRLLEWINAPLAGVSVGMREAMGKIAIITTINAIGVFVYVLFFRRH